MIIMQAMQDVHTNAFDWNLLLTFEALWIERNVTRAARRLGRTQSATSHALTRLREQLGDPLFVPTAEGMAPTPRAQSLAEPLRAALDQVRRTLAIPTTFDAARAVRTFRVATTDYAALVVLPSLIRDLTETAPGIDLVVRASDPNADAPLHSGEHDLALTVGFLPQRSIRAERLFADEFVCVRARRPGRRLPKLTLDRFADLPHLLVSPQGSGDAPVDLALRLVGRSRRVALRLPHFLIAPLVLASSEYVMTVPSRLAAVYAELLPLAIEPPPLLVPGFVVEMNWHLRDDDDPAHRFLRERITRAARRAGSGGAVAARPTRKTGRSHLAPP